MIFIAQISILNLRFAKNIDLNHKSIHDSVLVTYAIVIDIVSVPLYHTHSKICIDLMKIILNQIQKYSESYQKYFNTRLVESSCNRIKLILQVSPTPTLP